MVRCTHDPSSWEMKEAGSEDEGHLQLYRQFEAHLDLSQKLRSNKNKPGNVAYIICNGVLMSCTGEKSSISYDSMYNSPGGHYAK